VFNRMEDGSVGFRIRGQAKAAALDAMCRWRRCARSLLVRKMAKMENLFSKAVNKEQCKQPQAI